MGASFLKRLRKYPKNFVANPDPPITKILSPRRKYATPWTEKLNLDDLGYTLASPTSPLKRRLFASEIAYCKMPRLSPSDGTPVRRTILRQDLGELEEALLNPPLTPKRKGRYLRRHPSYQFEMDWMPPTPWIPTVPLPPESSLDYPMTFPSPRSPKRVRFESPPPSINKQSLDFDSRDYEDLLINRILTSGELKWDIRFPPNLTSCLVPLSPSTSPLLFRSPDLRALQAFPPNVKVVLIEFEQRVAFLMDIWGPVTVFPSSSAITLQDVMDSIFAYFYTPLSLDDLARLVHTDSAKEHLIENWYARHPGVLYHPSYLRSYRRIDLLSVFHFRKLDILDICGSTCRMALSLS